MPPLPDPELNPVRAAVPVVRPSKVSSAYRANLKIEFYCQGPSRPSETVDRWPVEVGRTNSCHPAWQGEIVDQVDSDLTVVVICWGCVDLSSETIARGHHWHLVYKSMTSQNEKSGEWWHALVSLMSFSS